MVLKVSFTCVLYVFSRITRKSQHLFKSPKIVIEVVSKVRINQTQMRYFIALKKLSFLIL